MDGYLVMQVRNSKIIPENSSPDLPSCQSKPFASIGVDGNDIIELIVIDSTPGDGGACSVDGGQGLDCEDIAPALFVPINIAPVFVEGRCAKDAISCSAGWQGLKLEYNDLSGRITLDPSISGEVWKYSVPQSCDKKAYWLHF
jgi:hypothetical protein